MTHFAKPQSLEWQAIALAGIGQDTPDQLRVGELRGSSGGGETRMTLRIRENAWQRVQFQNVRLPMGIETHVDAAPIPACQRHKGPAAEISDGTGEVCREIRWTAQDVARLLWGIPEPFGGIRIQGDSAGWQRAEADLDERQDRDRRAIP